MVYDIVIVGAGPAGIIAARMLSGKKVLVIEKGLSLNKRAKMIGSSPRVTTLDAEVEGVAGAGGWSDGKLCLGPVGVHDRYLGASYAEEAQEINDIFRAVLKDRYRLPGDKARLVNHTDDLTEEVTEVVSLGTSTVRLAFKRLYDELRRKGTDFILEDKVTDIGDSGSGFRIYVESGKVFTSRKVIVGTGKCDLDLIPRLVRKYNLKTLPTEPTVGFRIVVPNQELKNMKTAGSNPKLKLHLKNGDTVKTHCFAFGGEAISYACGPYRLIGGRADRDHPTDYATVALLYKLSSAEPPVRKQIAFSILEGFRKDYPDKIVYQDLLSFMDPSRPLRKLGVPMSRDSVWGTVTHCFPSDIAEALRRFVRQVSAVYGMDIAAAALCGPAAEWLSDAVKTTIDMETTRPGLYMVGDGSGVTQGIVASAVAGARAARSILSK